MIFSWTFTIAAYGSSLSVFICILLPYSWFPFDQFIVFTTYSMKPGGIIVVGNWNVDYIVVCLV